jgi:YidC/Oxa1 family membrane protein insertase
MERRVLLAISLSFLVLFLYQMFVMPARPPQSAGSGTPVPGNQSIAGVSPTTTPATVPPSAGGAPGAPVAGGGTNPTAVEPALEVTPSVADSEERQVVVETKKLRVVFTNRGARIRHWQLKDYKNDQGEPLDLVPSIVPPPLPLPFSLRVEDPATTAQLNQTLYRHSITIGDDQQTNGGSPAADAPIDASSAGATIVFEMEFAGGTRAKKTFVLAAESYDLLFSADIVRGGETLNPTIDWGPGLGDHIARTPPGSFLSPNYVYPAQLILQTNDDVERIAVTTPFTRDGEFLWGGVDDHYFISAVIKPPAPTRFEAAPVSIPSATIPPVVGRYVSYSVKLPKPPDRLRMFFGPKQLEELRAVDPEFTRAIYFGMFAVLAAPLLLALKWVYGFVGNWGWSIIVLTILINVVMFPLRHKSVVSMRRMQELQPQLKAIQDRYAKYKITDPERQKMNTEVMELYRSKGVNPASGCLPMLLTMPFLFAFYAMLGQAIEIRGADFGGWIKDLAAHDPLFITPVIMGATMFWQMRIQPSTADPTQQKVMMMMPVMFMTMMLWAPSGLVIYWTVSNFLLIGQQYLTNYLVGGPKGHNVRPSSKVKKQDS